VHLDPSLDEGIQRQITMEYMAKASQIISYEEIVLVWEKIPQTMQTRTPKLVYRARTKGPNLDNTYF